MRNEPVPPNCKPGIKNFTELKPFVQKFSSSRHTFIEFKCKGVGEILEKQSRFLMSGSKK
jgi:hypothetical protein